MDVPQESEVFKAQSRRHDTVMRERCVELAEQTGRSVSYDIVGKAIERCSVAFQEYQS